MLLPALTVASSLLAVIVQCVTPEAEVTLNARDAADITVEVANVGDHRLCYFLGDARSFYLTQNGVEAPFPTGVPHMGPGPRCAVLGAGESKLETFDLSVIYPTMAPGDELCILAAVWDHDASDEAETTVKACQIVQR
ncbi:hypothetical protein [Brevundimonas sp. UBA7664]|uniref:hypothetical protein n=1 Tax=Brevundimonas sp. UBA7664 TaxID=1946141 RepID=UPI0025C4C20D|nr:hypothetical protein [Brevundimonas sp. UBA7664]